MRPDTAKSLSAVSLAAILLSTAGLSAVPGRPSSPYQAPVHASDTVPRHDGEPADSVRPAPADSTDADNDVTGQGTRSGDYADGAIPVPEQPEATAFAPTMMEQYAAANPAAGITLITPPSANNRGTASLQYPFIMPPARNGMSPSLGLSYDSDAGDGLCGEGWTLPIPSVTVDTRWGVPRYDPSTETETYLLNGQMLGTLSGNVMRFAHRDPGAPRVTGPVEYFLRSGDDFSKITRTGDGPASYIWTVTSSDGTVYTYGGPGATLRGMFTDASGTTRETVAEWLLSSVRELHGDHVDFEYMPRTDTVAGNLTAMSVYLRKVTASTHFEGQDSLHTVVTLAYDSVKRVTPVSGRYGFLTASRRLLTGVTVAYRGSRLRSYRLEYAPGRFGRSLLRRVTHYDDRDSVAAFQEFAYYDDIASGSSDRPYSETATFISTASPDIAAPFPEAITDGGGFFSRPTSLGGDMSFSAYVTAYAGVGTGVTPDKGNTAGVSLSFNHGSTEGAVTLTDMNGDGLPDKVYRSDSVMYYCPHVPGEGGASFGDPVEISGAASFARSATSSFSGGLKAHVGAGKDGIAEITPFTPDFMTSYSSTSTYMSDVNGDGLTDIVRDGRVLYNHIETDGLGRAVPTFTASSADTPNAIGGEDGVDLPEDSLAAEERAMVLRHSPMQDIVRLWVAPIPGLVDVSGPARLLLPASPTDPEGNPVSPDGVYLTVQKGGAVLLARQVETAEPEPMSLHGIAVSVGDTLLFRVQCGRDSLSSGYHDRVVWSPAVRYTGVFSDPTLPNGETLHSYPSGRASFVTSEALTATGGLPLSLCGRLVKPETSDSLIVRVWTMDLPYDTLGRVNFFHHRTLAVTARIGTEAADTLLSLSVPNAQGDPYMACEVYSHSNVRWDLVRWTPWMACGGDTLDVVPRVAAFHRRVYTGGAFSVEGRSSVTVIPDLGMEGTHDVNMTVKSRQGQLLAWRKLSFVNGLLTGAPAPVVLNFPSLSQRSTGLAVDSVWVEYFVEDTLACTCDRRPRASIIADGTGFSLSCNMYQYAAPSPLGPMYGGWGAFSYGAGEGRHASAISCDALTLPADSSATAPLGMRLIPLTPETRANGGVWKGAVPDVYLSGDTLSAARLGVQEVPPPASDRTGGAVRAVTLRSRATSSAMMTALGVPPLSMSLSTANGGARSSTAFTDMNGDGYPDIITGGRVRYTAPDGGMSGESLAWDGPVTASGNSSLSGGWGAHVQFSYTTGGKAATTGAAALSGQQSRNHTLPADLSLEVPSGDDETTTALCDVNGDGLPDLVCANGGTLCARLNLGYSFLPETPLGNGAFIRESSSLGVQPGGDVQLPTGYDHGATSFAGGLGTASDRMWTASALTDVNGDGLPDLVSVDDGNALVRLNNGLGFETAWTPWRGLSTLGEGTSTSMSANAAATFSFTVLGAKVAVTPGAGATVTMARTTGDLRDFDGDGFPDVVTSDSGAGLSVRYSSIRRTNRLRTVTNSLGGRFTLDYSHTAPTYGLPGGKWVMSSVETDRGIHFVSGADTLLDIPVTRKVFTYSGGTRDRREREFLGFAEVVTTDLDTQDGDAPRRSVTETFDVSSYYRRGLPLSTETRDAGGVLLSRRSHEFWNYHVKRGSTGILSLVSNGLGTASARAYTPPHLTNTHSYENGAAVSSQEAFTYFTSNSHGELNTYRFCGDGGMTTDNYTSHYDFRTIIRYKAADAVSGVFGLPDSVRTLDSSSRLLTRAGASYGTGANRTRVTCLRRHHEGGSVTTRYAYDGGGNVVSVSLPRGGGEGERFYTYVYDAARLNTYPVNVTDPYGDTRLVTARDYRYGTAERTEDPNGGVLSTINDGLGRLYYVKSPGETASAGPTVSVIYQQRAEMRDGKIYRPASAVTESRGRFRRVEGMTETVDSSTVRVVTFVDGFGNVIQTRREATVTDSQGSESRRTVVEGRAGYDGLGRAVRSYLPSSEAASSLLDFNPSSQREEAYGSVSYDMKDRPLTETRPDGAVTSYSYRASGNCLVTAVTDPLGRRSETWTDAAGRTARTVAYRDLAATQPVVTRYLYDPVGRLTAVINAAGDSTIITYDMLGRRTSVTHPASGRTTYEYDARDNVTRRVTADGSETLYGYDGLRLTSVSHPGHPGDSVRWWWGTGGNQDSNTRGRVRFRLDGSGGTEYGYDVMGNVVSETRTVCVPGGSLTVTATTEWRYDPLGRLCEMTYPDGRTLAYRYKPTGELDGVYLGAGLTSPYVSGLRYDVHGARVGMTCGNGAVSSWSYHPLTLRLSELQTLSGGGLAVHRAYGYDAVGNITGSQGSNGDGGFSATYAYDALDRLVSASQSYAGGGTSASCGLAMSYDDLWRVTSKSQHVSQTGLTCPGALSAGYDMSYTYGTDTGRHYRMDRVAETHYRTEGTPTAADSIHSTHSYSYDPNGNLTYKSVARKRLDGSATPKISERKLLWDGDNRLRSLCDDGYVSLYWYDADGNRTVKERHGGEAVWVNSESGGMASGVPRWTVTPSGFITFDGTESYTEHVYIGSERVASIRRPFSTEYYADNVQHLAGVGLGCGVDYAVLISKMRDAAADACDSLGVPWGYGGVGTGGERAGRPAVRHILMAPAAQDSDTTRLRTPQPDYSLDSVYYYHRDHLGSTMTVTDGAGAPVQQVEYTPWGEVFVELRNGNSGFATPYLFNGKELDEETGLYFYGARYYDPKMSVWYSVDPLAMKFSYLTSYAFCHNNPIKFIDINGMDDIFDENGQFIRDTGIGSKVLIQKGEQLCLLSSFNYSENKQNRAMLKKIASYYLFKSDSNPFEIQLYELTPYDPQGAVFSNDEGTNIYSVALSNGRIKDYLDNKYDFWSITYHESRHRYDPKTWGGTIGEVEAIYQQSMHESWSLVSTDYIISQSSYGVSCLQKAINNNIKNLNIDEQIEKLNKAFIGYGVFNYNPKTKIVTGEMSYLLNEVFAIGKEKK